MILADIYRFLRKDRWAFVLALPVAGLASWLFYDYDVHRAQLWAIGWRDKTGFIGIALLGYALAQNNFCNLLLSIGVALGPTAAWAWQTAPQILYWAAAVFTMAWLCGKSFPFGED